MFVLFPTRSFYRQMQARNTEKDNKEQPAETKQVMETPLIKQGNCFGVVENKKSF